MDFKEKDEILDDDLVIEGKYNSSPSFSSKENTEDKVSDLRRRIEKLNNGVESLKSNLDSTNEQVESSDKKNSVPYSVPYGIDRRELEKRILSIDKKEEVEKRKLFVSKEVISSSTNISKLNFRDLSKMSVWPSLVIVFYGTMILIKKSFAPSDINWFELLQFPFEILVFVALSYFSFLKKLSVRDNSILCLLVGFESGIFIAIVKLFFYKEMWNIFYFSVESIFLGLIGCVIGFVCEKVLFEYREYSGK